jgi:hypothetical protein
VQEVGGVGPVVAAEQEQHRGPGGAQHPQVGVLQRARVHVHDVRTGRARDPVPGFGRHERLRADHREAHPAARRRARVQLGLGPGPGGGDGPDGGVHAGEDVGRGGGVLGEPGEAAVGPHQHGLRPRRTHVEAHGGLIGGHGRRA